MSLTRDDFLQRRSLPLESKVALSTKRIREWNERWEGEVYVSFSGGKDSTVLLHLVRAALGPSVPALFFDTGLEFPEVRAHVKGVPNVITKRPKKSYRQVVEEHGYPVVSKEYAHALRMLNNPLPKNARARRFYLTGVRARDGVVSKRSMLPKIWWHLITIDQPEADLEALIAGELARSGRQRAQRFKISERCCDVLKKAPSDDYEKETLKKPFVGTRAEDSALRYTNYLKQGCNAFDNARPMSTPLAFWTEQDILEYLLTRGLAIPSVYGAIVRGEDGQLRTTGEDRTGCVWCMFGAQYPGADGLNRFQRLAITHPKIWKGVTEGMNLRGVLAAVGVPVDPPEALVTLGRPKEAPVDPERNKGVEAPDMTMTETDEKKPPVHLYCRREGQLAVIGCGKPVSLPRQYTDDVKKASCRSCAKYAPGLTDEQRDEIWENAADRLGRSHSPPSPWMKKKLKAKRELEKVERKKTLEQERLLREQRRAERQARKAAVAS